MALLNRDALISRLSPPLDSALTEQLLGEFVGMERRYVQRDWKPSELDGAHFCEALARILYHQDSGNLAPKREYSECIAYIHNDDVKHQIVPRTHAKHIARVLGTIWQFRSQRGVAHQSAIYVANQMDARLVMEMARWCLSESLLIFGVGDREEIARIIREVLRFDVPCIGKFGDVLLVQRTDLTAEQEALLLLHHAKETGLTRREVGKHMRFFAPPTVTTALGKLEDAREIVRLADDRFLLTDLGEKRFREELGHKLML